MEKDDFFDSIVNLINLGAEGTYWDFKSKWHENNADLLHDIICMANNLEDRDAYIIIGVGDSNATGYLQIIGVPDQDRKNQQNVIDFLRNIKFAGENRPVVYVETINFDGKELDVITIKKTSKTPFYLVEKYVCGSERVFSGHIYVRVGDTNTPKNETADVDKVEYLWRKRFGIDLPVKERLSHLLDEPSAWVGSFNNDQIIYHSIFPEFQIRILDDEASEFQRNDIATNISDHFSDKQNSLCPIKVFFHTTCIFEEKVLYLDGARHLIPLPMIYFNREKDSDKSLTYLYFDKTSLLGKLFLCLAFMNGNWYGEKWKLLPGVGFLLFEDQKDQEQFNEYALERIPWVLEQYERVMGEKGYSVSLENKSYFHFSRLKADEIKSRYLYNKYKGFDCPELEELIPRLN